MTLRTLGLLSLPLLAACFEAKDDATSEAASTDGADGGDGADGSTGVDSGDTGADGADGTTANDADGDGFSVDEDCDDADASVYPGADEDCTDVDRDCDGDPTAGAVDAVLGWQDTDGDGYGDPAAPYEACELPAGVVPNDGDCDDSNIDINPSAAEICDGSVDEDCDGAVDAADPDIDACDASSWNGTYAGSFSLDVTVSGLGVTDTCSGTGTATVDASASPQIETAVTCDFVGTLAALLPGPHAGEVEGDFDTPNTASGTLDLAGIVTDTWSGVFSSPDTFEATISGSTTYSGYAISYVGTFTGAR